MKDTLIQHLEKQYSGKKYGVFKIKSVYKTDILYTLRKKDTKADTGVVFFQKEQICTL